MTRIIELLDLLHIDENHLLECHDDILYLVDLGPENLAGLVDIGIDNEEYDLIKITLRNDNTFCDLFDELTHNEHYITHYDYHNNTIFVFRASEARIDYLIEKILFSTLELRI